MHSNARNLLLVCAAIFFLLFGYAIHSAYAITSVIGWDYGENGQTGFEVLRCTGTSCTPSMPLALTLGASARQASDTTVLGNTSYCYGVRAVQTGANPSPLSTSLCITIPNVVLAFTQQPQNTPVGQTLPPVVVQARDPSGNPLTSYTGPITISLNGAGSAGTVPQAQMSVVSVNSQETTCATNLGSMAIDNNSATFWHTQYCPTSPAPPHTLIVNLGSTYTVVGFTSLPRQDGSANGTIKDWEFYVSADGVTWGTAVATGTWPAGGALKSTTFTGKAGNYVKYVALTEINGNPWTSLAEFTVQYGASSGTIPQGNLSIAAVDSQETTGCGFGTQPASNAIDGSPTTIWHTAYCASSPGQPHTLTLGLGLAYAVTGITYLPRPGGGNGTIAGYEVYVSADGVTFGPAQLAVSGTWAYDATLKTVTFPPKTGTHLQLKSLSEGAGNSWTSAAEVTVQYGSLNFTGTLTRNAVNGVATFDDLVLTTPGTFTLHATTTPTPLVSPDSTSFIISEAATHLAFLAQPQNGASGLPMQAVTVQALDANNHLVTGWLQPVTIALGSNPGSGTLSGTLQRTPVNGVATFNNLSINNPGVGYTLTASSPGLSPNPTSNAFTLITPPPVSVEWHGLRTARQICSAVGGDSNDNAVQGTTGYPHSLTCSIPARLLSTGSGVRVCTLLRDQHTGTSAGWSLALKTGATALVTNTARASLGAVDKNSWTCFRLTSTGPPGASVGVGAGFEVYLPKGVMSSGQPYVNMTAQPVTVDTSAFLPLSIVTQWAGASPGGTNVISQLAITAEALP